MSEMKEQEDLVPDSYVCSTAMMACSRAVSQPAVYQQSVNVSEWEALRHSFVV